MSFTDPDRPEGQRWLGSAVIKAPTMAAALAKAHRIGANPGGEVQGVAFEAESVHPDYLDTLVIDRQAVEDMPAPVGARVIAGSPGRLAE
jgi:hypothetical protein